MIVGMSTLLAGGAAAAPADTWPVEGERDPSTFDCDHLYYSNAYSGAQFVNDSSGDPTIDNTVITRRTGSTPPTYWSSNMALGKDPDTGATAAFYSSYSSGARKLYKHVSGTNVVTDLIAGGAKRDLPAGSDWGGIVADPNNGMLYGAQNGGAPKLFGLDLATGESKIWTRGQNLVSEPAGDPVFASGTLVPDMFIDADGGVYYGLTYKKETYIYRLDPVAGTTTQAVKVTGPGTSAGFSNYGMAYFHGAIYLGHYTGALYKVDPKTGVSEEVPGGLAHQNQVGRIKTEPVSSWQIMDLASCTIAPNLVTRLVVHKTASQPTAKPGDVVRYQVTVTNEGNKDASAARAVDDLARVVDDASYNNDAEVRTTGTDPPGQPHYDPATKKLSWTGEIPVGATVTLTYSVTVGTPPGGDKRLDNTVVVPESNCVAGSKDPACSVEVPIATLKIAKTSKPQDPAPGSTVTYTVTVKNDGKADWAGAVVTDDLSGVVDDSRYNDDAVAKQANGASAGPVSYDRPNRKLRWTGDVAQGETVTIVYTVTVDNPPRGDKRLVNRVVGPDGSNCGEKSTDPACVTDEPISGLVIRKAASPANAKPGDTVTYTITAENVGAGTAAGVTLADDLSGVVDDADYNNDAAAKVGEAEASRPGYDSASAKLTWTGDIPAGQTATLTYTVRVHTPPTGDLRLRNAVTGPENSTCPPDSTDPACVTDTPIGALEIKKTADKTDAKPGDRVTYQVTVRNTGQADYPGASFSDDLSGVVDDATWNGDATATSGTVRYDGAAKRLSWSGDVPKDGSVTVTYSVTVKAPPSGDHRLRNAVTGPEGSTCPPGSSKPECTTETKVGVLELKKTASPETAKPGETVVYTVTAHNPGAGTYAGAGFTDDLSRVLGDATYNNDERASQGAVKYTEPTLTWSGDLPAGATATITYSVTVKTPYRGDGELRNTVTGPPDSTCPPGATTPDCSPVVPVAHLRISKTTSPAAPRPGDTVTYHLTVTNEGKGVYRGARVTDDLSQVLDDAVYNNDASATTGTTDYQAPVLTWTGDLAAGATATISYTVTVDSPPKGDKRLVNAVTGTPDTNCPPDGKDPDCGVVTPLPALKVVKTATPDEPKAGDKVTYTVTVENVGEAEYRDASFTDDMSDVLDDAVYNNDAAANVGTTAFKHPKLTWSGTLAKGQKATVTYSVKVNAAGDHRLRNVVTATGSNCGENSADPDCRVVLPKPHLEVSKTAQPKVVEPGGKVAYTLTIRNAGEGVYRDATLSDDLSGVLDDAVYNDDGKATSGTVSYERPHLTWRGTLEPGAVATITYTVTVESPPKGDRILKNTVDAPGSNCVPAEATRADQDAASPECGTETPVRSMAVKKHATPGSAKAGDKIGYTITVSNPGPGAYDDATFTDDLSEVLEFATYNGDVRATSGTAELTGTRLNWHGRLGPSSVVTITYSVTVKPDLSGDHRLRNVVISTTPGTNCVTGTEPDCSTDTPVHPDGTPGGEPPTGQPPSGQPPADRPAPPSPPLASTGTPLLSLLLSAVFLLLVGFGLAWRGRRSS